MHSRRNLACDDVTLLAMTVVDLNLLTALDALLAEGSRGSDNLSSGSDAKKPFLTALQIEFSFMEYKTFYF
jgi:hypothetical protein